MERHRVENPSLERIRTSGPTRQQLVEQFGREALTEHPDGTWSVRVSRADRDPQLNRRNLSVFDEMMGERRRLQTEESERQAEEQPHIDIRHRETGEVRKVRATLEDHVARKPAFLPVRRARRGTRYMTDRFGQRWKRKLPHGEWEPDDA